jgi:hypothetical protein
VAFLEGEKFSSVWPRFFWHLLKEKKIHIRYMVVAVMLVVLFVVPGEVRNDKTVGFVKVNLTKCCLTQV